MTDFHYTRKHRTEHILDLDHLKIIEVINYYEQQHAMGDGKRFTVPKNASVCLKGRGDNNKIESITIRWTE